MRTFFVNFIGLLAVALLAEDSLGQSCQKAKDASRIAVAGGSITEIIYFLGEQSRIIAVDRTSNFPPEAGETPSVGYVRNLSSEGLLSLKPTLVLGENDMGPEEVLTQLRATSVETRKVNEKHTSQGIVEKIRCVSSILGVTSWKTLMFPTILMKKVGYLRRKIFLNCVLLKLNCQLRKLLIKLIFLRV